MRDADQRAAGVALVAGAGRGLGLEFGRQQASSGLEAVTCCRTPQLSRVIDGIRSVAIDAASVNWMAETLHGRPVDRLINNAASRGAVGGRAEVEHDDFLSVMTVNVLGPLLVTRALLPNLRKGRGVVANIGSRARSMVEGRDPDGDYAYKCSKSALNMVTVKLADDTGLTDLSPQPGWVKTDMGGSEAEPDAAECVAALLSLPATASPKDNESFRAYDGNSVAW